MTATNHALTGAIIGLTVANPLLAIIVAFVSHFVCDAIPHFGVQRSDWIASRAFRTLLLLDATACGLLVIVLAAASPHNWLVASVCAFMATSPDLAWAPGFFNARRSGAKPVHRSAFTRFASWIQWYEKPSGAIVEAIWAVAGITIVFSLV